VKKGNEPKAPRVRVDARPVAPASKEDRVRLVRVNGPAGRTVRWHVSRTDTKS
jgi:hypothetical protein